MKKLFVLLAALALLGASACAQEDPFAALSREEVHGVVDVLFAAAAGTSLELELAAREDLADEELALRNAQSAAYRRLTLPWLVEAFRPLPDDPQETGQAESQTEPPPPGMTAWTLEDGFRALQGNALGQTYLMIMRSYGGTDALSCMQATQAICRLWLAEVDHAALRQTNADYACWIYAPGSQIDYPIVQGKDNAYYLDRLFDGRKNASGTLFMDYRNLSDFRDPNTLIFGHHMRNQSMFGALDEYADQAYFESHPFMLVFSEAQTAVVELFSAYTTDSEDHCYDIAISDTRDLTRFVDAALRKSDFAAEFCVEPGDRLVTLSTCAYAFENARYIVIGRVTDPQRGFFLPLEPPAN